MTWRAELPYSEDTPLKGRMEWLFRSFRNLSLWTDTVQGELGYGGLIQRASVAIPDITSPNYATVPFDEGLVSDPYLVFQDPDNDLFQVEAEGLWFISSYGSFLVDKLASADRQMYVRFYNIPDATPISANPFPLYVEENVTGVTWSFTTLLETPASLISKSIRMEIGGATADFTGITLDKAGLTLLRIPTRHTAYTTFLLPSP